MTPKEKAQELYIKFIEHTENFFRAKQCAIIAVDELINHCSQIEPWLGVDYWQQVRQEIANL